MLNESAKNNAIFGPECMILEIWYRDEAKMIRMGCLILQNMPLGEQLGAQSIPVDRCLNKSSHPAPVRIGFEPLGHGVIRVT